MDIAILFEPLAMLYSSLDRARLSVEACLHVRLILRKQLEGLLRVVYATLLLHLLVNLQLEFLQVLRLPAPNFGGHLGDLGFELGHQHCLPEDFKFAVIFAVLGL